MLTLFTTAKPFRGHIDVIQRNALRSWKSLHPDIEIPLFGDDAGAAECAGTRYSSRCQKCAGILMAQSIWPAFTTRPRILPATTFFATSIAISFSSMISVWLLQQVVGQAEKFLMSGRRLGRGHPAYPFASARQIGARKSGISLFVLIVSGLQTGSITSPFERVYSFTGSPNLSSACPGWDNWLLWFARSSGANLVDASAAGLRCSPEPRLRLPSRARKVFGKAKKPSRITNC